MDATLEELFTSWTARLAVGCYLVRVFADVGFPQSPRAQRAARCSWTAGCLLLLIHVAGAFHFYHDWSHRAAYEHTARQTAELLGIRWGGGLYFNYAFAVVWMLDVMHWWFIGILQTRARRMYFWGLHLWFAFMVFNATVVFGPPFWKWMAVLVAIALIMLALLRRKRA